MRELPSTIQIRLASKDDLPALVAAGDMLFDYPVKVHRSHEYFSDPRLHLAIAMDQGKIVGMVSGVHYVHPDKEPELFINEASVLDNYQNKGIGQNLIKYIIGYARKELDCKTAWVATEKDNIAARKAYRAAGGKEDENIVFFEFDTSQS